MRNGLLTRSRQCLSSSLNQPRPKYLATGWQNCSLYQDQEARLPWSTNFRQGIKTKATVSLSELSSDAPEASHVLSTLDDGGKVYPTVVSQALNNMEKYENCVLLTKVGSFYEVYPALPKRRDHADRVE